jgi:hypothetical protein
VNQKPEIITPPKKVELVNQNILEISIEQKPKIKEISKVQALKKSESFPEH